MYECVSLALYYCMYGDSREAKVLNLFSAVFFLECTKQRNVCCWLDRFLMLLCFCLCLIFATLFCC